MESDPPPAKRAKLCTMAAADENKNEDFPIDGVKLSWINQVFIPTVCGGRDKLENLTTWEVLERFTKGNRNNTSYCQKLKDEGTTEYFLDVVEALSNHLKDEANTVILWWDLFSINQHIADHGWTFEWLSTTFKSAIKEIGRVAMVMSPWNDPKPYTRTWCVYEAYCAISVGARFEIALGEKEEKQFIDDMCSFQDEWFRPTGFLWMVRAEDSECTNDTDKKNIFNVIQNEIGFEELGIKLFELYGSWVASLAIRMADDSSINSTHRNSVLLDIAKDIWEQLGDDRAERVYLDCLEAQTQRLGDYHPDTWWSMKHLAQLYELQKKYDDSGRLYLKRLEAQAKTIGEHHPDTLNSMKALARFYKLHEKYDDLERMCFKRLKAQMQTLGEHHHDTLEFMEDLARFYKLQRKYDGLERLYLKRLEYQTQRLGKHHDDTLKSMQNLVEFYESQNKYDMAEVCT